MQIFASVKSLNIFFSVRNGKYYNKKMQIFTIFSWKMVLIIKTYDDLILKNEYF